MHREWEIYHLKQYLSFPGSRGIEETQDSEVKCWRLWKLVWNVLIFAERHDISHPSCVAVLQIPGSYIVHDCNCFGEII